MVLMQRNYNIQKSNRLNSAQRDLSIFIYKQPSIQKHIIWEYTSTPDIHMAEYLYLQFVEWLHSLTHTEICNTHTHESEQSG